MSVMYPLVTTALPSERLRPYVSHYWLSRGNRQKSHVVLPDGSVDLVLVSDGDASHEFVYGTTTVRQTVALEVGRHYLGVRFRPGQSRHFLRAAAVELTDTQEAARGLLAFDLRVVPERVAAGPVFAMLDVVLQQHLQACPPSFSSLDAAIREIEGSAGRIPIPRAAAIHGRSLRQFERQFQLVVGVAPKLYARIERFRRALRLVSGSSLTLAEIAADLGYTDQSHMSHEFRRFAGLPPAACARSPVDFLQDR